MEFRKIDIYDLNENIIGKRIKDSNEEESFLVINWVDDLDLPIMDVVLENRQLIDSDMLLRDYDIEVK